MTESERAASEIQNAMPKVENGVVVTSEDFENWTVSLMLNGRALFSHTFNSKTEGEQLLRRVLNIPLTRKATPWRRIRTFLSTPRLLRSAFFWSRKLSD